MQDAGVYLSIRQQMQECRDAGDSFRQRMLETLYQTTMQDYLHQTDAGVSLYQTADAGDTLYQTADAGCRRLSIRQRMQEYLHQTVDTGVSPSGSGYRSISIR